MKRLAIVSTHPIQYNAPFFRILASDDEIDLKVFYSKLASEVRYDTDFGREIEWDVPLLDGYLHESFNGSSRTGRVKLIHSIAHFKPTALLVYGWNFPGHWKIMRHFHGKVPVWFRGDSTLLDPLPIAKRLARKWILTTVYKSIDRAFYVGQANKAYFEWSGLKKQQLCYAPHAVANDYFTSDDDMRNKKARLLRADLGIQDDAVVFLFAGKLEPKKQPVELAHVFLEQVRKLALKAHLVIIGTGALENDISELAQSSPWIHWVGFKNQSEMPIWYRVGDVICLPSRGPGETWGLAVNEAMACGCKAIISNRVGCAQDLGKGNYGNLVVPFNNFAALGEAMIRMSKNRLNESEHASFLDEFSYHAFVQAIKYEFAAIQ